MKAEFIPARPCGVPGWSKEYIFTGVKGEKNEKLAKAIRERGARLRAERKEV